MRERAFEDERDIRRDAALAPCKPQVRNFPNLVNGQLSARLFLPSGACGAAFVPCSRLQSSIIGGAEHPFGVPGTGVLRPFLLPMKIHSCKRKAALSSPTQAHCDCAGATSCSPMVICGSSCQ